MLNWSINRTAAQDLKTNRSVKCRFRFIFLHVSEKKRLFYILQKMLHTALPAHKFRREALSEAMNWQPLTESILHLVGWKVFACQKQRQNIRVLFFRINEHLFPMKKSTEMVPMLLSWSFKSNNWGNKMVFCCTEFSSRSLSSIKTNTWEWTASKASSIWSDCV